MIFFFFFLERKHIELVTNTFLVCDHSDFACSVVFITDVVFTTKMYKIDNKKRFEFYEFII